MEVHYKRIAFWGRLMGIVMMLTLPLMVIGGLISMTVLGFGFGLLVLLFYGLIGLGSAWVGKKVYDAGEDAKAYLANPTEENMDAVITDYGDFLFANVVYTVVAFVAMIPIVTIALIMGIASV